jgi:hypothetical protein
MNKRPGQVKVTTEVAFCSFCARPRTLRVEERQLGTLVRTVTTCETCHRTLSSTIGVASAEPADAQEAAEVEVPAADVPAQPVVKKAAPAPAKRAPKAAAVKPKAPAARKTTKSK